MAADDRTRISARPGVPGQEIQAHRARITIERRMGRPVKGEFITLLFGSQLLVGREKSCEIFINDDRISRKHALIRIDADAARISDLGSTNGSSRNQVKITDEIILQSGDQLNFGQAKTFQARIVERDGVITSIRLAVGTEGFLLAPQEVVIGRSDPPSPDVDLMIYDPKILPRHARLEFFAGQVFLVSLDPERPALVNSAPARETEIKNDYLIEVGDTLLRYEALAI